MSCAGILRYFSSKSGWIISSATLDAAALAASLTASSTASLTGLLLLSCAPHFEPWESLVPLLGVSDDLDDSEDFLSSFLSSFFLAIFLVFKKSSNFIDVILRCHSGAYNAIKQLHSVHDWAYFIREFLNSILGCGISKVF